MNRLATFVSRSGNWIGAVGGTVGVVGTVVSGVLTCQGVNVSREALRQSEVDRVSTVLDEAWALMGGGTWHSQVDVLGPSFGELTKAKDRIENALRYSPDSAEAHHCRAAYLWLANQPEDALATIRHAADLAARTEHTPKSERARINFTLGKLLSQLGDVEGATKAFQRAVQVDPLQESSLLALGSVLRAAGEPREAQKALRGAIEIRASSQAYYGLALTLNDLGDTREALKAARRALNISPSSAATVMLMGDLLSGSETGGSAREAVDWFRRATQLEPGNPRAHTRLGMGLILTGRLDEGVESLQIAAQLEPSDVNTLKALRDALKRLGRMEEAKEIHRLVDELLF